MSHQTRTDLRLIEQPGQDTGVDLAGLASTSTTV